MLYPLFPIVNQFELKNGALNVAGYLRVFYAARTDVVAPTYADNDGESQNPEWIILDNNARARVYVDIAYAYNLFVYDRNKNLLWTQYNMYPENITSVSVTGMQYVTTNSTLSGDGTPENPLGVKGGGGGLSTVITQWPVEGNGSEEDPVTINDLTLLATDDTMTAYNAEVEGKNSIVLGVNGDWFTGATSGFQTIQGMYEYATNNALISNYNVLNGKIAAETKTREQADASLFGLLYLKQDKISAGNNIDVTNNVVSLKDEVLLGNATKNTSIADVGMNVTNGNKSIGIGDMSIRVQDQSNNGSSIYMQAVATTADVSTMNNTRIEANYSYYDEGMKGYKATMQPNDVNVYDYANAKRYSLTATVNALENKQDKLEFEYVEV